ncbi:MAG: hypothetical protein WBO47_12295, partial [Gammaproteobacteria bacterium]
QRGLGEMQRGGGLTKVSVARKRLRMIELSKRGHNAKNLSERHRECIRRMNDACVLLCAGKEF